MPLSATHMTETRTLANGLTVIVQPMPWLRTAAFTLSLRAGVQCESNDQGGLASMVCEMVQRGAGNYSSRDLVAAGDNLGMERHSGVSSALVSFGAAMPAESLPEAVELYGEIVRRPHLPADQLDDARLMAIHELRAIEDEPPQRVMRRLRELHYGPRLGRTSHGTLESLQQIDQAEIRDFFSRHYHAGGAILAIAGRVDPHQVFDLAERVFGDWRSGPVTPLSEADGEPAVQHLEAASSQTHIGFSFDAIPFGHDDYFKMRAGVGILSDGMSSRLFDRVREQRGLCYTVAASCHSLPTVGGVFGYAGTTPQRAQETLDVTVGEIQQLADDLQPEELERWKVRIESSLIMEQESSASRASSLASDYYQLGRVMPTEELERSIEALSLEDVREYWRAHPPAGLRVVTLGPQPLKAPGG